MRKMSSAFTLPLILVLSLFYVLCVSCSQNYVSEGNGSSDDKTLLKSGEDEIFVDAAGRNESVYVCWNLPKNISFESVKIYCEKQESPASEKKLVSESANGTGFLIQNLENGTEYQVFFEAVLSDGRRTEKEFSVVPQKFDAEFDNLTAVLFDGEVHLSWAFKNDSEISDELLNVAVYCEGKKIPSAGITQMKSTFVYEEISDSATLEIDGSRRYGKYYSCVISGFDSLKEFDVFAVNRNGAESICASVRAKKALLPVVFLDFDLKSENDLQNLKDKKKLSALCSVKNSENEIEDVSCTVKGRGNSSWTSSPKKSWTLKFKEKQAFLGMKESKSFALVSNYFDRTLLRNSTAYRLGREIFQGLEWTADTKSVNLFVNGIYQGVYTATETNKIAENRINIPNLENCADSDDFENYGFLLEANAREDESFNFTTERGLIWSLKEPDGGDLDDLGADISSSLKEKIVLKVQEAENALYSEDFSSPESANYWKNYFDSDSLYDWILVQEFSKNTDSNMYSSCYMYFKPAKDSSSGFSSSSGSACGKFCFGPIWDFDLGFGNNSSDENAEGWKTVSVWKDKNEKTIENWFLRLFSDSGFKSELSARWNKIKPSLKEYFSRQGTFSEEIALIENDASLNFARWDILGKGAYRCPSGFEERETYKSEIDFFDNFLIRRMEWIDSNI